LKGEKKMTKGEKKIKIISYLILSLFAFIMIFPFLWMVVSSFKPLGEIYSLSFFPKNPTINNYKQIFTSYPFSRWFINSLIIALISTISVLFFDSLVGYTLSKYEFPGKQIIFLAILSTLMVPTEMLAIPWYIMSSNFGWVDTYWGIVFPGMMSAFGVFLIKQFMDTLPDDLLEAARIDGLSEFGIYRKIALPLVKPALATLAIFNFIGNWNAFFWPLIVTSDRSKYTLPVGLAYFSSENLMRWELIMTGATISTLPIIIVFLIFQKQIMEGIVMSGLK